MKNLDKQTLTSPQENLAVKNRQRKGTNRVTMQDVAEHAGVSASTVSLYLRDPKGVSEKRGQKIQAAIDAMSYVPNLLAGGLAATHTKVIAVIVPSLMNAFFAQTVSAMQRYLNEKGYQLLVGDSDYDELKEQELVRTFLAWSPTGLIMTGASHTEACLNLLKSTETKVIQTWELTQSPAFLQIGFSHYNVGRLAASHLFSLGRKQVAYIGAQLAQDRRAKERGAGFCQTWLSMTKREAVVIDIEGQAKPISGVLALKKLLTDHPNVDAVFCSNDIIAMGLMLEAVKQGVEIPKTLSVISFGDLPFAEVLTPGLTTIRPPSEQIGQYAIDAILENRVAQQVIDKTTELHSKIPSDWQIDLAFELVIRGSS